MNILQQEMLVESFKRQRIMNAPFVIRLRGKNVPIEHDENDLSELILNEDAFVRFGIPQSADIVDRILVCTVQGMSEKEARELGSWDDMVRCREMVEARELHWVGTQRQVFETMQRTIRFGTSISGGSFAETPCPSYNLVFGLESAGEFTEVTSSVAACERFKVSFALKA